MFYTIYKITNTLNGKIYIGKHQTTDINDDYMGSGKHLRSAQEKYGIDNFIKVVLFQFNSEDEMNAKEAELVTEEFCLREDTYNLCPGGKGGWGYVNMNGLNTYEGKPELDKHKFKTLATEKRIHLLNTDKDFNDKWRKNISDSLKTRFTEHDHHWIGKTHSEETKEKLRKSKNVGSVNSQYGTMWITNGQENKKIKRDIDVIPEGWSKGRK
jgi:hypothetical protein